MRAVASLAKLDFFLFQSHHVFRYTNDIHTFFQLITVPLSTWMMPETPPLLFPLSMLVCYIGALKKEWEISRKKIKSRAILSSSPNNDMQWQHPTKQPRLFLVMLTMTSRKTPFLRGQLKNQRLNLFCI